MFLILYRSLKYWNSLSCYGLFLLIWHIFIIALWTYDIWILNFLLILCLIHWYFLNIYWRNFCDGRLIITSKRTIQSFLKTRISLFKFLNILANFFLSRFICSRVKWNLIILCWAIFIYILSFFYVATIISIISILLIDS